MLRSLIAVSLLCVFAHTMVADERAEPGPQPLLQRLPKEGAWVEYFVTIRARGDETQPRWKAASVGRKDVDGEPHRWLELSARNDESVYVVYKGLIPESAFGPGRDPLAKARELWVRQGDGNPRRIRGVEETDPYMALILRGPVNSVEKQAESATVRWQRGNLECEVWVGRNEIDLGLAKVKSSQRLLQHESVPFGIAGAVVELESATEKAKVEFSLTDMGADAKTLLPGIR